MLEPPPPTHTPSTIVQHAKSVGELFLLRVQESQDKRAYLTKHGGNWLTHTWQNFYDRCAAIASFMLQEGLQPGDKVCIVGKTRAPWALCDIAGHLCAGVTVGAYPTLPPAQLAYIIDHADTKFLFLESGEDLDKVMQVRDQLPKVTHIILWDTEGLEERIAEDDALYSFEDVLATPIDRASINERLSAIDPDETAIIVYTSGTTGPPKGAMITNTNIITLLREHKNLSDFGAQDMTVSFLPMAHVAERVMSFYGRIATGIGTAFASSVSTVLEEVQELRPTLFGSVPRIFEKAYAKMMSRVESANPRRQKLFRWAESVGRRVVQHWQKGEAIPLTLRLQYKLVDRLIFSKIREVFGGQVRSFLTGAAPIAYEILEFFWAAGFPIYEVYGMTEATVLTHGNFRGSVRLGSVGQKVPFLEDRIAEDGEILLRGPTVFKGYYKNPEATAEAIDEDGWLHTGDIGRKDEDGFLYIVDRKKHIIITAGGKNLTPANIENEIKSQDPLISQAHVHGDRKPYLTAIVTLHPQDTIEWGLEQKLVSSVSSAKQVLDAFAADPLAQPEGCETLMKELVAQPRLQQLVVDAVKRANEQLARVETIKRIHLLERDFSVDQNELTPTLKVKRKEIERKFADTFDKLYEDENFGLIVIPS